MQQPIYSNNNMHMAAYINTSYIQQLPTGQSMQNQLQYNDPLLQHHYHQIPQSQIQGFAQNQNQVNKNERSRESQLKNLVENNFSIFTPIRNLVKKNLKCKNHLMIHNIFDGVIR
jgi:hypothetical protein